MTFFYSFIHSFSRIHYPCRPEVVPGTTDRAVNKKILVPTLPEITLWRLINNTVSKAVSIVTTVLKQATGEVGGRRQHNKIYFQGVVRTWKRCNLTQRPIPETVEGTSQEWGIRYFRQRKQPLEALPGATSHTQKGWWAEKEEAHYKYGNGLSPCDPSTMPLALQALSPWPGIPPFHSLLCHLQDPASEKHSLTFQRRANLQELTPPKL